MKNIAIICEYNPFHNGHAYQIASLKDEYPDANIVCIMSGNYVQRAEPAIYDKYTRAHAAILGGADLVLELPFPYSLAGAEYFASAGVHIANSLGCIDMLSFGSECGDIKKIEQTAKNLLSDDFNNKLNSMLETKKTQSYASSREKLYEEMYGCANILTEPNNILAIEYIKALIKFNSDIRPITIERKGNAYNNTELSDDSYPSASALRLLIQNGDADKLSEYVPEKIASILNEREPADMAMLERGVLAMLRLADTDSLETAAEGAGGLGRRIHESAKDAKSLEELLSACATKKYTNARIRRVIFNYLAGVREADIKAMPKYTQMLAANEKGRAILKRAKKNFNIITKPADYKKLDADVISQVELSHKADSIYTLMRKSSGTSYENLTSTPYIE